MRLLLLTAVTMIAFAANSVLSRMALADGETGPAAFSLVRLAAGAAVLMVLLALRTDHARPAQLSKHVQGAVALAVYVLGFSYAYRTLDAGVGALLLFGVVQITMFIGALGMGERVPSYRWLGAGIAFAGLAWLLWPGGENTLPPGGSALMCVAAVGWGIYSLLGKGTAEPLRLTAWNFVLAVPIGLLALAVQPDTLSGAGLVLALVSGAVTSGLGYALWYAVIPQLGASRAAVVQLSVPVIATAGGMVVLAEPVTARIFLSAILVLGGVALSLIRLPGRG